MLAAVHARIPMVTADERRALQREVAADESKFWEAMQESNEGLSTGYRWLAASAERSSIEAGKAAEAFRAPGGGFVRGSVPHALFHTTPDLTSMSQINRSGYHLTKCEK